MAGSDSLIKQTRPPRLETPTKVRDVYRGLSNGLEKKRRMA